MVYYLSFKDIPQLQLILTAYSSEVGSNEKKYGVLGAGDENGRWQIGEDSDDCSTRARQ